MTAELFDTHAHYEGEVSGFEAYYNRAAAAGVKYILSAGAGLKESRLSGAFADAVPNVWFAAGAHPHIASKFKDGVRAFDEFRGRKKLVAVGEIGLDYYYGNSERNDQLSVFESFLSLALEWRLPAIVHCRDAANTSDACRDTAALLSNFSASGGTGVLHCFAGSPEFAEKFLSLGFYISVAGIVTFPKAQNIRDLLRIIPDDRLLIETDAPWLAPLSKRGKPNHPEYLIETAARVAAEKGVTPERVGEITSSNAFRLFNIEKPRG
jgi:TatD DNase family protein